MTWRSSSLLCVHVIPLGRLCPRTGRTWSPATDTLHCASLHHSAMPRLHLVQKSLFEKPTQNRFCLVSPKCIQNIQPYIANLVFKHQKCTELLLNIVFQQNLFEKSLFEKNSIQDKEVPDLPLRLVYLRKLSLSLLRLVPTNLSHTNEV